MATQRLIKIANERHGCIVYQDIDAAELLNCSRYHCDHLLSLRQIGLYGNG